MPKLSGIALAYNVIVIAANETIRELRAGRGDGSYDRKMLTVIKADLLILDDIDLYPLKHDAPVDLYGASLIDPGAAIVLSSRHA
ncbi:MAG: ATP-binding protein [Kofleriaceae bacterium]|nr:ATP-binding protein [Kofleriaceae bacterium]